MKRTNLVTRAAPTARLADFCDVYPGVQSLRKLTGEPAINQAGVRLVTGRDFFTKGPFGEHLAFFELHRPPSDQLRLQQGDIILPRVVARRLRARIVDSALVGCFAHHTVNILRPRAGAPSASRLANYLCSAEFLEAAQQFATGTLGDTIHLPPAALSRMPFALPGEADQLSDSVVSLMDRFVRDIIRVIARNRAELENVEWRVLEQVLAAAFEGIGFDTHLTPPSKDGGKDIVLECVERGTRRRYIVEVKHWVCGKAVPGAYLKKFLNVIVNEKHDAGLFLSTSGFARNAYDALIHLEHKRMRVAGKDKIVHLCRLMVMREMGLWTTDMHLTEALFEQTDVLSGGGPRLPGAGTGEVPL